MAAQATAVLDRTYASVASRCTSYAIANIQTQMRLHASVAARSTAIQTAQDASQLRLQYQCSEDGIQSIPPTTNMAEINIFYKTCAMM